uniref:cadherin-like domain-containing protein n=1 Tax=Ferrovibrio terrae TaxID=2594003 RepID=UPI003137A132
MPTNQNPDSINDSGFGLLEDRFLKLKPDLLLGNDSDPDGNTLSILSVQSAVGGTVAFDQDGDIVFTPTTNFHGAASFTYTVSDGNGGMDTATVSLNVTDDDLSLAQVSTRIGSGLVSVQDIRKGDFNGDGITDLQVINSPTYGSEHVSGGATVSVAYANGVIMGQEGSLAMRLNGGDFSAAAASGPNVYKFTAVNFTSTFADIDNDGDTDIVAANAGTSLGFTEGGASPDATIDATRSSSALGGFKLISSVATDFNGDGKTDLFASVYNSSMFGGVSAGTLSMAGWMGTVTGPSATASFTAYSGVNPVGGATQASMTYLAGAGDINNDGYGDIVTSVGAGNDGYYNIGAMKITFGNAAGSFEQNLSSNAGGLILTNFNYAGGDPFYRKVAFGGDVDGNGAADMAGWGTGATGGFVLFGNASYAAGASVDVAALNGQTGVRLTGVSSGVSTMALGDLNGDGLGDIVVGSSAAAGGAGKLWVIWGKQGGFSSGNIDLSQEATGQFITLTGAAGQGIGSALSIADINGDGKNDLVIGSTSGTLDVVSHFAFPQNNAAPVAQGETLNGTEDQALTIQASALLSNDTDANGDILSIAGVSNAVGGSVTLNANGSVTFTPTENVNGPVSFEYTVSDGRGGTANATATINLAGINDAATVSIDRYTYASVDQVSSQYQSDISNFINVLTDTHETVALPEQYRNGTGPISLDNQEREVIVHFHSEVAGNQSVIGFYVINTDGSFGPARIVFPNASQTPPVLDPDDPNNPTDSYTSVSLGMFPAGTNFGLFMISNGAGNAQTDALIDQVTAGTAQISFVNGSNSGLTASLFDTVAPQLMVHDLNTAASTGTAINQSATPVFHTAASENAHFNGVTLDTRALNIDGAQHAAAGQGELNDGANTPAPDRIAIGWEDLAGSQNPDFDFNDVIIQVEIAEATVTQVNPANVGAAANLTLSDIDHPDQADADLTGASFRIADGFVTGDALGLGGGFTIGTNGAVLNQGVATGISVVGGGFGGDPANPNGLTLTGLADLVLYEQILRSVTFTSSSATAGIRTLNITVTDTGGAISPVAVEHLVVGNGTDQNLVGGTTGDDILTGTATTDLIYGDNGNDTLVGGSGDDLIYGGDGQDAMTGGIGADVLNGGAGNDTASYGNSASGVTVHLGAGPGSGGDAQGDTLTGIENLTGSAFGDNLTGDAVANALNGGAGDDTLIGDYGNDTLDGGADGDWMDGGADDDTLIGGAGADMLIGNIGADTASYASSSAAVTVNLGTGTGAGGDAEGDTLTGIENLIGSAHGDTLNGDGNANVIQGGAGQDMLNGGAGADVLSGGTGTDNAGYDDSAAAVTVNLATGTGSGGDAQGDTLTGIENVSGSDYADTLTGDANSNVLNGNNGADILNGGGGADILLGGDANDTLNGEDGDDQLNGGVGADVLNGGMGSDTGNYGASSAAVTVSLATSTGTGGDAQGDTLTGIENLLGSAYSDTLTGDGNANILNGDDGNDTLRGGAGADVLIGGAGVDTASYAGSTAPVSVNLATGTGSGGDAQGDTLTGIENLIGTDHADTLTGDGNANTLDGGYGHDLLQGGGGNDTLLGYDDNDALTGGAGADVLDGGAGIDTASYAGSTIAVTVNLGIGTGAGGDAEGDTLTGIENLTGSANDDVLTGDGVANVINGGAGNDSIAGGDGSDTLNGGEGNDTLNGGAGSDSLTGGAGDDTYNFDGSDSMTEAANAGSDTVVSSLSYTLAANFENLTLTGTAALNATGNDVDNILIGNSGANTINAGLGADTLQGGGGNDSLFGYAGNDTYRFGRGDGVDTVLDEYYYSYTTTVFTYSEENGYYWDTNTYWTYGNAGNDTLEFGAGITAADLLFETSGNNLIVGLQNAGGTLTAASQAADRVVLQNWYDVNSQIENFRFADGSTLLIQSGSTGDDVMTGSSGDDRLWGAAGNDTITGNAGNDQIDGGDGNDTLNGGDGNDQ